MKKKIFTFLFIAGFISFSASSQTIKENIDKAAKDKNNADRAAKADVLIHKRIIYDSTSQTKITPNKVVTKTPEINKIKSKKHKCKKKFSSSSK